MGAVLDVSDIIISPATAWIAAEGEALPDETTVEYGDAWGGNWAQLGSTLTPVTLAVTAEEIEAQVQQVAGPVKRKRHTEGYTIETTLAELNPANIAKALNGSTTNTAAGASQRAFDEIKAGGKMQLTRYVIGFEGEYEDDDGTIFPVRAFLLIATVMLNGNLQFSKSEVTGIPLQAKALYDTTKTAGEQAFVMHRVTAEATTA